MSYFIIILLLYIIKTFSLPLNSYEDISSYLNSDIYTILGNLIDSCGKDLIHFEAKCVLNFTKYYINELYPYMMEPLTYEFLKNNMFFKIKDETLLAAINLLESDANNKSELISYFIQAINCTNYTEIGVLDYIMNIIDESEKDEEKIDHKYIIDNLSKIFHNEWINEACNYIFNNNYKFVSDLFILFRKDPLFDKLYNIIQNNLRDYEKQIYFFIYNLLCSYGDTDKVIRLMANFLKMNTGAYEGIKTILRSLDFITFLKEMFNFKNMDLDIIYAVVEVLYEKPETLDTLFIILNHTELIDDGAGILINVINFNISYLVENLPSFVGNIKDINRTLIANIGKSFLYIAGNLNAKDKLGTYAKSALQISLRYLFRREKISSFNISSDCIDLFNYTFFQSQTPIRLIGDYLKKFISDSPINKGDFLGFDNCMDTSKSIYYEENPYNIKPVFVIVIVENPKLKMVEKNNIFSEKDNYITNYCLPYGYKINSTEPMCSEEDYKELANFYLNFLNYKIEKISTIPLYEDKIKVNAKEYTIGFFSIFLIFIPIIIKLVLVICAYIENQKRKKNTKINKLISSSKENSENQVNSITSQEKNNNQVTNKNTSNHRCRKILNEFFDIIKNGKELFNFDLNNTNSNNVKGMTYIKGLIGLSVILNIFGQTFAILFNLPLKEYGLWHFHKNFFSILYVLAFVGYKYSPRILFSCSGYTLIYKYLCYIEQEGGYYFLKFVFLQSYKYILLFGVLFLFQYSTHNIVFFLKKEKRPLWVLYSHYIEKVNLLKKSFSFLLWTDDDSEVQLNLLYIFFMAINEIFFFIFGTILISLGYKYKFRIDLIILGIIIFCFAFKIVIYYSYFSLEQNWYTTTSYYISEFGSTLINPFFNLSCFLIGMYFGLINYSIQKGIIELYKKDNYKKIYLLKDSDAYNNNKENINLNIIDNGKDLINNEKDEKKNRNMDINEDNNEKMEKIISKENKNNKEEQEYLEQVKAMPFLISPICFFLTNRNNKDKILYNILILISAIFLIFIFYNNIIFAYSLSYLNIDEKRNTFFKDLSLVETLSNKFLNLINLIDSELVTFLLQFFTFILFIKETEIIRSFFNHNYWLFFFKSYFSYILMSGPVILGILYECESVIKMHINNIIFYSLMNFIYIFLMAIIFYSCFELPLKKIFKYFLKGNEIIEEEDDDEDNEEEEEEENEEEDNDMEKEKEELQILKTYTFASSEQES